MASTSLCERSSEDAFTPPANAPPAPYRSPDFPFIDATPSPGSQRGPVTPKGATPTTPSPYRSPDFPFMDATPSPGSQRGPATPKSMTPKSVTPKSVTATPPSPSRASQYSLSPPKYTPPPPPVSPGSSPPPPPMSPRAATPIYSPPSREDAFSPQATAPKSPYRSPDFPFIDATPPATPSPGPQRGPATPKSVTPPPPSPSRTSQYSMSPPNYTPPSPGMSPGTRYYEAPPSPGSSPDIHTPNYQAPPLPAMPPRGTPTYSSRPRDDAYSTPTSPRSPPEYSPSSLFEYSPSQGTTPNGQSLRASPRLVFPPPPSYSPDMSPQPSTPMTPQRSPRMSPKLSPFEFPESPTGSPQQPSPFAFPGSPRGSPQQPSPFAPAASPAPSSGSWASMHADHNFASPNIMSLSDYSFNDFIRSKEKVLVFFYDANQPRNSNLETEFSTAAGNRLHPLYGFAAVDCFYDQDLCDQQNISRLPMFKLFSNGFELSSIADTEGFNANQIHQLMKMTPILTQPRADLGRQFQERADGAPAKAPKKRKFLSCI